MPNVILEAMASGLAVIATDVGASSLLVNERTGWLLKYSDVEELLGSLKLVVNSKPEVIDSKKQNALHHITENFTWERLVLKFYARFFN